MIRGKHDRLRNVLAIGRDMSLWYLVLAGSLSYCSIFLDRHSVRLFSIYLVPRHTVIHIRRQFRMFLLRATH